MGRTRRVSSHAASRWLFGLSFNDMPTDYEPWNKLEKSWFDRGRVDGQNEAARLQGRGVPTQHESKELVRRFEDIFRSAHGFSQTIADVESRPQASQTKNFLEWLHARQDPQIEAIGIIRARLLEEKK